MTLSVTYDWSAVRKWEADLRKLGKQYFPLAMKAAIMEVGFFFEREAKLNAPVDTGRLRASIGHGPEGVWNEHFSDSGYFIDIGTNVEYAPYMEFGFTMSQGHVAYIKAAGGFRYVHPFTFEGVHFMQRAANATERMIDDTIERYLNAAIAKAGF